MKLGDLFIKLGLKSQEFEQGVDKAKGKLTGFGSIAKTVGGVLAGAFAISSITAFAQKIFATANEIIQLENSLAAAISATGKDVESTLRSYKRFADELENITLVDAEVTLGLLRLAEAMQSKAPQEAAKNAVALSKALGVDLNSALKMAVMAQSDMYTMLGRYSPALRAAGTEAERTAEYNKILASGMKIAATEVESAAGKIKLAQNAWEEVWEAMALVILQNEKVLKSLTDLATAAQMLGTQDFGITSFLAFLSGGASWEADKKRFEETMRMQKAANEAMDEYEANIKGARKTVDEGAETQRKYGRTIAEIEQEITDLKETLLGYGEYQTAEIQKTLAQIKANEELIKTLTTLNEVKKRQTVTAPPAMPTGRQATGGLTPRESYAGVMREAPVLDTSQLDDMTGFLQRNAELTKQYTDEMLADWVNFNAQLSMLVEDFSIDVVDQFGSAIGELLATGEFPSDFGANILASIGRFISTLGKMLIALGVGSESFKALLKTGFLGGGVGAIAAGAALVALGGAISSYARAKASGGAAGGGGGPQGMYNQQVGMAAQPAMAKTQLFLRGDDIYLSQTRNDLKRGLIG